MRIAICQPLIPHYRVPVFELLGRQPGIELTVFGGESQGSLETHTTARYFRAEISPIRSLPLSRGQLMVQPAQLEVLTCQQFDLVILPWDIHYFSAFQAVNRGRRLRIPVVLWGHGYSKHRTHKPLDAVRNWLGRRAAGVLLYTRTVAERLIASHGFDRERVFVASNAISQKSIQPARQYWVDRPHDLKAFQDEHGLDPHQTLIFISRLEPENRVEMLLEVVRQLRPRKPRLKAILVGKGSDSERLRSLAERYGISDAVVFTGAIYENLDLAPWMLSSTVFCYPVNIGLSLMHAFGFGLPVVTSDDISAHNPEIEALENGVTGMFYRDGDVRDMAAKCERFIDDPQLRARAGEAARKLVTSRYTIANMVQGFLDATVLVDGVKRTVVSEFGDPKPNFPDDPPTYAPKNLSSNNCPSAREAVDYR